MLISAEELRHAADNTRFTDIRALLLNAADALDAHEAAHEDHKRLVRRLDVALNGEAGAAPQASLCDVVSQVESFRRARDLNFKG